MIPFPTCFYLLLELIRGVYWPPHFSVLVWTGFWGGCQRDQAAVLHLGMSRSLALISQMMQSSLQRLDILFGALKVLNEELEQLELRVSWVTTKIQAFNDILDAAILSLPIFGEDDEVTERFTFLGSDIYASVGCEPEVKKHLVWAWGVMDSLDLGVPLPVRENESPNLQVIGASSLALWM